MALEATEGQELERVRSLLAPLAYELLGACWTATWRWSAAPARKAS